MKVFSMLIFAIALSVLLCASSAQAIDIAIPSDFMAYEIQDNDPTNMGYYLSSAMTLTPSKDVQRPYAFIMDPRGNLMWYFTEETERFFDTNIHYTNGKYAMCYRNPDKTLYEYFILDSGYTVIDTLYNDNPYVETCTAKWHGVWFEDDGTTYYLWDDEREVDMSGIGGDPNCMVKSNAIQQWDADGNLLWAWYGHDHVDQLIYECRNDPEELLEPDFTHLHINSFQVLDNGDILCHARVANTIFLIDRATGNVAWGIGGWGVEGEVADFTFTTSLDLPEDVGMSFIRGHDAFLMDNGTTLTFFDNGKDHEEPLAARAYGRVYELDIPNRTADLTFYYYHPDEFATKVTGSTRLVEDEKLLIGWGGATTSMSTSWNNRPTVSATEVDTLGNTIWEIKIYQSPYPVGVTPKTWRWHKSDTFTPANEPYLSHVYDPAFDTIELYANWFGHEAEITSYDVYVGLEEGNMVNVGNTVDGVYFVDGIFAMQPYWFQVEPMDEFGVAVGPMSNVIHVQGQESGLVLTPQHTTVPGMGGYVVYGAQVTNATTDYMPGLVYQTEVVIPNGNTVGPLLQVPFTLFPLMDIEVSSLNLAVNPFAPNGDYTFVANVLQADTVLWTDSFGFTKGAVATGGDFNIDGDTFISGGDLSPFYGDKAIADDGSLPSDYRMTAAYPNPFNPTTAISIALPEAADLTVAVYNVTGQLVATLADDRTSAGTHSYVFDAANLAGGMYFVHASTPGWNAIQKVLLIK